MEVIAEGDYSNELYIIVNGELQVCLSQTYSHHASACHARRLSAALLFLKDA